MKNLCLIIFIISFVSISAQGDKSEKLSKFEFSYSYGISYLEYAKFNPENPLNLPVSEFGSFQDLNIDYRLPKNRFIGIGFSRQQHSELIDKNLNINGTGLQLSGYKNMLQTNYFDVHFRQDFNNGFHLTFGLFYFSQIENGLRARIFEDSIDIILFGDNINDGGIFISPEYYFDVNQYLEIGIKAKAYYSFGIFEAITLLPTARFKF